MRKKLLLSGLFVLFCIAQSIAQQRTVTGKVTSAYGTPLSGASVLVVGQKTGERTNTDGTFSIKVPANAKILEISYVGYEPFRVSIVDQNNVAVSLQESSTSLNAVVVTGYSSQRVKDITGSVAVVNVSNLKTVPAGTGEALLQGQAAGVTVVSSGAPGQGSNVKIRGITSIGNSDPLYIIDGVQGSIQDIDVNDIQSIQVLKDAGAAAIYGVRGSNGVIVVTTKKGRQGPARITYDGFIGTQRPLKKGFNIANTSQQGEVIQQQYFNDNQPFNNTTQKQFANAAGQLQIPDYITPTGLVGTSALTDPATYKLYSNQITKANKQGTDWFHEIFKPATQQSHTLSASGGSDKSSYYMSLGYFDQQGTLIGTYLKRYSARINTVFNVKDHIRVGENAFVVNKQNPSFTNQNEGNAISYSYRENPIIPVYDIMGNFAGTGSQALGNSQNPVANQLRSLNNKSNDWAVSGNAFAEVDFLQNFTIRTSFGGSFDNYYYYYFNPTAYENAENNTNPNTFGEGGGYNSSLTWTNTLKYSNTFGQHNIQVLIGTEAITSKGRQIAGTRSGYFITNANNLTVDPNLWTLGFGPASTQTNTDNDGVYQSALYSQFGRLDYTYGDRYLLTGTIRRDGASVFAPGHQYGYFPSVTAGWRLSKESFFPTISWINDLKIRGGYGVLGNYLNVPNKNAYNLYSLSAANANYDLTGANNGSLVGAYASQIGNVGTTWEKDKITNVGLDGTLFSNKVNFSLEWYKKAISGLFFGENLGGGFAGAAAAPQVNLGNIENHGIDLSLTYHGSIKRDLKFDVTGTFTTYKNKVVSLAGQKYQDEGSAGSGRIGSFTRLQPGQPIGEFFGYQVVGLYQSWSDTTKAPKQQDAAPGRFKFKDVNGDGVIDDADRTFFGNPNPKFTAGINLSVSYKGFDLTTFLYASVGNKDINYVKYWTDFPQVFQGAVNKDVLTNSAKLINAAGQPTYVTDPSAHVANPGAAIPVLENSANFSNTTTFNSFYMEDGSYLRMKTLNIGYTLPAKVLSRFKIDQFRIYVQASNLFTITKYTGLDPELQTSDLGNNTNFGIDFGNYPANQKYYSVGVNLTF
jgi:TonB-dependent starch-binding outer membrane protein SusC